MAFQESFSTRRELPMASLQQKFLLHIIKAKYVLGGAATSHRDLYLKNNTDTTSRSL